MPAIALLYAALAAGLLVGFGGFIWWLIGAAVAAAIPLGWRREYVWLGLLLATVAAALLGDASRRTASACLTRIAGTPEWLVDLEGEPAGAWWRGRWVEHGCATRVSVQRQEGLARSGSRVRVRGEYFRQGTRVQLRDATLFEVAPPDVWERARSRSGAAIDRLYPRHRALVRALLIADQRDIERGVRDAFADSGLVHMLSVSGLHVAIIFGAIQLVLAIARLSPAVVAAGALSLTAAYIALIGAPAPAIRAAVMLGAGAVARAIQRPTSAWAVVALGGLLPLANPETVRDIGYQLSMAGIVGLVAAGSASDRWLPVHVTGWRRSLAANALTTTLACVATLPISAQVFGRTSIIAPLSNLIMAPLVTLLQPALFLSLALAPVDAAAGVVADAASVLMDVFTRGAAWLARIPNATRELGFTPFGALALYVGCIAVLLAALSRRPGRALTVALGAALLLAWQPLLPLPRAVELHMIDVGQGDAFALRAADGSWVLFDAGDTWRTGDAGERMVLPYLKRRGGAVRAVILSHAHADHAGGVATVLRRAQPRVLLDGGYATASGSYQSALLAAQRHGVRWWRVKPGDSLIVAGAKIRILAPDSAWAAELGNPNEASVVARVDIGPWRALMTGDAEHAEEAWLLRHAGTAALRSHVLKVAHHGSATSSTAALLDAVRPRVALISVGAGNTYGHPDAATIAELEARRAHVLRSDRDGAVVLRFDRQRLTVRTMEDRWDYFTELLAR